MFPCYLQFSWRNLCSFPFYYFTLFLCVDHLGRLAYLSLLFSGTLHSFEYIFPFLLCLLLLLFSQLFVRSPETTILPSYISFFGRMFLIPVSCTVLWTTIHSSSGTLPDLIPLIYSSSLLHKHKGFDLCHTWIILVVFPTFFNLSLNFAIRSSWFEPQAAPGLFCWL